MHKFLASLALVATVAAATPAMAHDRGYYDTYNHRWVNTDYQDWREHEAAEDRARREYWEYRRAEEYNRNYNQYNRREYRQSDDDIGKVIAPLIVGGIIGAIIGSHHDRDGDRSEGRHH